MTKNQIEYWKNVETARNNRAVEAETNRSNLAREAETNRSNLAQERELRRSHGENERLTARSQFLTLQQNRALNELEKSRQSETHRNNVATLNEKQRQRQSDYDIAKRQLNETQYNNRVNQARVDETIRSNKVGERLQSLATYETQRANVAREQENRRINSLNANIAQQNVNIQRQRNAEIARANRANELISMRGQSFNLVGSLLNTSASTMNSAVRLATNRR
jgi:hypothetical protein